MQDFLRVSLGQAAVEAIKIARGNGLHGASSSASLASSGSNISTGEKTQYKELCKVLDATAEVISDLDPETRTAIMGTAF
eukprot:GSA25T00015492001.1